MSGQTTTSSPRRRTLGAILAGGGVLALCACLAAVIGGGVYYFISSRSATASQPTVEYILDASPRMDQQAEGGTRLEVAQAVLAEIVRPADGTVTAGLRVFGTGAVADSCKDTNLLVPLAQSNQAQIADSVFTVAPGSSSDSAMAEAMIAAIRDLAATKGPHTLVVVTGGADSCNAQASELIKQEAERAGIKLQQFVIGFMVDEQEAQAIKTLVDESGSGDYVSAPDANTLRNLLAAVQQFITQPSQASHEQVIAAAAPGAVVTIGGSTPLGEASPTPGSDYPSQTACDHPYLPLRPGATWKYSSNDGYSTTWTVNGVTGDLSNATASLTFSFDAGSISYEWTCTPEGITYIASAALSGEGTNVNYTFSNQSGATILSAARLKPGARWNSSYTMTATFTAEGVSAESTSDVSDAYTAGKIQSLTSGLGTFDVIPVASSGTNVLNSSAGGQSFTFTMNQTQTIYYAYGIGIIRTEYSSTGQGSSSSGSTELVSYNVP